MPRIRNPGRGFAAISPKLRAHQDATLAALRRGDTSGGRAIGTITVIEPPEALLAK